MWSMEYSLKRRSSMKTLRSIKKFKLETRAASHKGTGAQGRTVVISLQKPFYFKPLTPVCRDTVFCKWFKTAIKTYSASCAWVCLCHHRHSKRRSSFHERGQTKDDEKVEKLLNRRGRHPAVIWSPSCVGRQIIAVRYLEFRFYSSWNREEKRNHQKPARSKEFLKSGGAHMLRASLLALKTQISKFFNP